MQKDDVEHDINGVDICAFEVAALITASMVIFLDQLLPVQCVALPLVSTSQHDVGE
jgi:hypothetical protein